MTLRAATDSGVVVFPRLPMPADPPGSASKRGQSPRKQKSGNPKDSKPDARPQAHPTRRWRMIAASGGLVLGLILGFIARPALLPPKEVAQQKAEVAKLTVQLHQTQAEITNLQSRDSQRAAALSAIQADLTKALQHNVTLRQTQTTLQQASTAQHTRVTELNAHLATLLKKTGAALRDTPTGVIVRFPDNMWFVNAQPLGGGAATEIPTPALRQIIDQLDTALAAPPAPIGSVQIRSMVRSQVIARARHSRPVVATVDAWAQSALRAAMIGSLLRERSQLAQLVITAAGAGAVRGPRAPSFVEIEVTLLN